MTRRQRPRPLSCVLALLALAGCDGVGRALVDEQGDGPRRVPLCSDEAPNCQNVVASAPPLTPPLLVALGLEQCASTSSPCPMDLAGSAPRYANVTGCSLDLALPEGDSSMLGRASCAVLKLLPVAPAQRVRLTNVELTQSVLTLASEVPVVVELTRARVTGTHITLRGPVTLRLSDQSALTNVWIDQPTAEGGVRGASLELVESRAQGLTVGLLGGRVRVLRSSLENGKLWADDVVLETASVVGVSVVSRELDGVELNGRALTLQVGRATLAQLELASLAVQRCDTMLIVGSRITASTFAACGESLRVDDSAVDASLLVGAIESSVGTWNQNAFGVGGAATDLQLWGGSLLGNRYCPGLSRVSFARVSTLECNVCDELPTPEQRLCPATAPTDEQEGPSIGPEDNPLCPLLAELHTLPVCAPPVRNENPF